MHADLYALFKAEHPSNQEFKRHYTQKTFLYTSSVIYEIPLLDQIQFSGFIALLCEGLCKYIDVQSFEFSMKLK